jgi:hypothetical protein
MAKSKQGEVQEEHTLLFTEDGKAASLWWTEETGEILSSLGTPAPGIRNGESEIAGADRR